ncbi:type II secretion system protein GspD [Loktanella sp. D2R18]|uniref:type II secretion system secretin GspD n=1 Tax=Rhodobacterales TaxID=204455 RepID=UPI000DE8A03F|nr:MULTISPECIES: type II secretion system secretin GspD [Rhodobacterales]MDO6591942.1 type II secretion system secretin GspD [Yoonia sp. 1_MG-2023]RBW45651.1 type II secretion system protein GspD [Loktanella sp. D2R18]
MTRRTRYTQIFSSLAVFLCLAAACADDPNNAGRGSRLLANQNNAVGTAGSAIERFQQALNGPTPERRVLGTDTFLAETRNGNLVEASTDGSFTLNLVNVPIAQAANAVLGEALERNYTVQPDVSGSVTLQTTRPLSERELLETFQTVLELNGAVMQVNDSLISIVPAAGATQRISNGNNAQLLGARVVAVPLEYIGTTEMVRLLEPIIGSTIRLQAIPQRNILLIAGTRDEINAAIEAVNLFDVDVLKGKSVGLFRLRAAEPEAVVEELNVIFETREGGSLQNVLTFVPSTRLSAILVVTSRSQYLQEAETWIRDLDRTAGGATRRPVVYNLQSRSADDLAPILTEMLQEVSAEESANVQGTARIVADATKNAIIVWGNDTEQESLARLINSLDSTPVQVLLEATIAEVSLNDELNFGLRWFFENGNATFSDVETGGVASNFPGLSLLFNGASSAAAINALNSITDVNVVSSPSLMVLNNQEATLQIGDEVPIATQQVVDTSDVSAPIVNTISFRDTGILLTVKPRVSSGGQVILEIEQEVSSVSNTTTSGIDSPTISQRRIETSVIVTDGQTIALGGLIQESNNQTNTQVPGAGDVPILGALFRNRSDTIAKTELLILITPRVIRNGQESRSVTDELRQRISGADGLITNGIGVPSDGHRIID